MSIKGKKLSNPSSTGGAGPYFEAHVQASFVVLMLTGGYVPCLPCWPITKIKLQGKVDGFDIDDLIVFVEEPITKEQRRLLVQARKTLHITPNDEKFGEIIKAALDNFRSPQNFTKNKDVIAVITGALISINPNDVYELLAQARHTLTPQDFFRRIETTQFSSEEQRKILDAFRSQLKKANDDKDISEDELYDFLRNFRILNCDLGRRDGVVLSLFHSHMSQFNIKEPPMIWGTIVDIVQNRNQHAGIIIRENLPPELRDAFKPPVIHEIPDELTKKPTSVIPDLSSHPFSRNLGLGLLLGGWDENSKGDISVISQLTNNGYDGWINSLREALDSPRTPLSLRNGIWATKRKKESFEQLGPKIFDSDLKVFKKIAIEVLSEKNPAFELPADQRSMANVYGKVFSYSRELREGIANTLAFMGNNSGLFPRCSDKKAEIVAKQVVRQLLGKADWETWGSLNVLLPLLAEAAPDEFLAATERALKQEDCPFKKLFSEESAGVTGNNYMTGLLWALEALAWDEQYLTRVTVLLGELSTIDPGGRWANRPTNSLTTIFLPWHPQTTAPPPKRLIAVRTLVKEVPEIAWPLLISLLPNQHRITSGSRKPQWRQEIEVLAKEEIQKEYWSQVTCYADLAIDMAKKDLGRLKQILEVMADLPPAAFDRLLNYLSSEAIIGLPERDRTLLWSVMMHFSVKHRRFADADWAVNEDVLRRVDAVAENLAPKNPSNFYRRLFCGRDFDLYIEADNWKEQQVRLDSLRQEAVLEIFLVEGLQAVIRFAEKVQFPNYVGTAFGTVANNREDEEILPELLNDPRDKISRFVSYYIQARHKAEGWEWADRQLQKNWGLQQKAGFLTSLPFCSETWDRVESHLGKDNTLYWKQVDVIPCQVISDYGRAIDKLLENERPNAAIDFLHTVVCYDRQPLDHGRIAKALLAAVTSKEPTYPQNIQNAVELIKTLQADEKTDQEDLFNIEWVYLVALSGRNGARPKTLEQRLASDPKFFSQIIRLVFLSDKGRKSSTNPSAEQQNLASHAYELLFEWRTPPGKVADGNFSPDIFRKWLKEVVRECKQTGHLAPALEQVGKILYHAPSDPSGLWIDKSVAEELNAPEAEEMRSGFMLGYFNSRGVHIEDPTGQPEKDLAEKYRRMASDVEEAGYHRLAVTMRDLAKRYDREADKIISENQSRQDSPEPDTDAEKQK